MGKRLKSKWVECPQCRRRVKKYSDGRYSVHYVSVGEQCNPTQRAPDAGESAASPALSPQSGESTPEVDPAATQRRLRKPLEG